jgi:uncharacterized phiE125 gp8 family phage protein
VAELLAYLSADDAASEPIAAAEVKAQARIDADLTADDDFIQAVLIPGARQLAETRTGAAIRPARYRQRLRALPQDGGAIVLANALVTAVESVTYVAATGNPVLLSSVTYEVVQVDRETLVAPLAPPWPETGVSWRAVEIIYTAGLSAADFASRFPSVKAWMLMAAAWGYAQRELFVMTHGAAGFQELPADYLAGLLDPLTLRARF